jgi:hypothetical protein
MLSCLVKLENTGTWSVETRDSRAQRTSEAAFEAIWPSFRAEPSWTAELGLEALRPKFQMGQFLELTA